MVFLLLLQVVVVVVFLWKVRTINNLVSVFVILHALRRCEHFYIVPLCKYKKETRVFDVCVYTQIVEIHYRSILRFRWIFLVHVLVNAGSVNSNKQHKHEDKYCLCCQTHVVTCYM